MALFFVSPVHLRMHLPFARPQLPVEPPALVCIVAREDVQWNRPIFKAPPLEVQPPLADVASLTADVIRKEIR